MRIHLIACFALAAGCGSHSSHDEAKATLSIDPPTSTLMIVNDTAATEAFTATLTYPDGSKQDVTADATFSIGSQYGTFSGAQLSMTGAGKTTVTATYGDDDKMASAQVIGMLTDVRIDAGLPQNIASVFSGATEDPSRAPTMVYPPANVIMPRNVGDFEIHWTDTSTNNVYEMSLTTEFSSVTAYVAGNAGSIANSHYDAFIAQEWTDAVADQTSVQFQVRGMDLSNPGVVGSAPPQDVQLSNEELNGGLYYWASSSSDPNEPYGIYRHDMSRPGQPAEQFLTTAQTSGRCIACHVLSRQGDEMAITYDGGDGAATTVNVASSTANPIVTGASCTSNAGCGSGMSCEGITAMNPTGTCEVAWNFGTFTPDGKQFLAVHDGVLTIYDYATQAALGTMPAATWVSHPDLSPDGTRLVYATRAVNTGSDWSFDTGNIFMRTYDQATMTFGPEQQLVADGANNYYPSFSPDGQWILFNKADNTGSGTYNNANAELWVMKSDNSAPPVQLSTMNVSVGLTDSWGRWAPFQQSFGPNDEAMYWITVSSKRDFGVRLVGVGRPQVWMTPFFADRAAAGQDPSAAGFRLPFQDIVTNNHIAQWTQQIVE
ncbi:MAG TPA: hypothetical protein VLX92_14455 [Kofleriaceae bacterium]|nr:hypothetical protein [Kofleriaceae bacterium]